MVRGGRGLVGYLFKVAQGRHPQGPRRRRSGRGCEDNVANKAAQASDLLPMARMAQVGTYAGESADAEKD